MNILEEKLDIEEPKIQIIKLSASSMKTYEQCPLRYRYTYIDKLPRKEFDHFDLGNLCHKTLENFHEVCMNDNPKKASYGKIMKTAFTNARKEFEDKKLSDIMKNEAYDLILTYLKTINKSGMPDVKGVEKDFSFNIRDDILIRGFIDRLDIMEDGRYHIVDYKTTKREEYLDSFQLLIYGLWLKKEFGNINSFKGSYVLLRHGSKYKEYEFNTHDLDMAEKKVIAYAEKIKNENTWTPIPTRLCNWCDFVKICPTQGW